MKDKQRAKRLKDYFNLTIEESDKIDKFQNEVCFFCHKKQRSGKHLATDHSHVSGLVRGKLCSDCNRILGRLERGISIEELLLRLLRIISYLKSPPAVEALGRQVFTFKGRLGTKKHRKYLRQLKAKEKASKSVNEKP